MRRVQLQATAPDVPAAEALRVLVDLDGYPQHTSDVHHVRVVSTGGRQTSEWEVAFGNGILRWIEEDEFDAANGRLNFRLLEGDIDSFAGRWSVLPWGDGCLVTFDAEFDLDIPGLADVLEPVAAAALADSVRSILRGLLGAGATIGVFDSSSHDSSGLNLVAS